MKSIKQILFSALLTLGIFCAVLYGSCSKDACRATNCLNGGTCSGGICQCPDGLGGSNCQVIYSTLYSNTYIGTAAYNTTGVDSAFINHIDTNNNLVFSAGNDSNFNQMQMVWNRTTGNPITMAITLSNNSPAGSDFTVTGNNIVDTFTYTDGSGSISSTTASLKLTGRHPNGPPVIVSLNNFNRQ